MAMHRESSSQSLHQIPQNFDLAFYFFSQPQDGFRELAVAIERNIEFIDVGPGTDMYSGRWRVQQNHADYLLQDLVEA